MIYVIVFVIAVLFAILHSSAVIMQSIFKKNSKKDNPYLAC